MLGAIVLLAIIMLLSYLAAATSDNVHDDGKMHWNFFVVALLIFLILFNGLRTYYNDTTAYIREFVYATSFKDFMADPANLDVFDNPAFYALNSWVRGFTNNANVFFMLLAIVINSLNMRFFIRHIKSKNFVLSMVIYACIGFLMLTNAAIKQVLAMSILTLAIDQLIDKHYIRYFIIVYIAGLFHTYAWLYFILPLIDTKPWSFRTFILLGVTLVAVFSFKSTITSFLEVADSVGKDIAEYEIISNTGMNRFRIGVFGVLPLASLLYKGRINEDISREKSVFIQMSIFSFMFIIFASIDGANMFGRAAEYFDYGIICAMPYAIRKIFNKHTASTILLIAVISFSIFFLKDNTEFSSSYKRKTVPQFITEITHPAPINDY